MTMDETHMQELMELEHKKVELERQKLAIQFAAVEVRIDDKIQAQTRRIIEAITGAVTLAATDLKSEMLDMRSELKADIAGLRTELKGDIRRLEEKFDAHAH